MAKKKQSPKPPPQSRRLIIFGATAVAVLAGLWLVLRGVGGTPATQPVDLTLDVTELQRARGVEMGSPDAPVQLHEFADFQCPACQQFSTFIHPLIKERLIDPGLLRLVRYDFPLISIHPHAFLAARAARCAGDQERYWEYHDVLYGRQATWSVLRNPSEEFVTYSALIGLDRGAFERCLRSDLHAEEVTRNLRLGESLGVSGTPSFMLNGQRASFGSYQELEETVLQITGRQAPGEVPGV